MELDSAHSELVHVSMASLRSSLVELILSVVERRESHLQRLARALVVAWAVVVLALD